MAMRSPSFFTGALSSGHAHEAGLKQFDGPAPRGGKPAMQWIRLTVTLTVVNHTKGVAVIEWGSPFIATTPALSLTVFWP